MFDPVYMWCLCTALSIISIGLGWIFGYDAGKKAGREEAKETIRRIKSRYVNQVDRARPRNRLHFD